MNGEYSITKNEVILERSPVYTANHKHILAKHADELLPQPVTPPQLTVVYKASRELLNGHLGRQLTLLAKQRTNGSRVEAIVVVNNPRYYEAYARVAANDETLLIPDTFSEISAEDPSDTRSKKDLLAEWMQTHDVSERVSVYRENLATLNILQTISSAVSRLQTNVMSKDNERLEIENAIRRIEALCPETMTTVIKAQLVEGARAILKSKMMVMGLDCISMEKGFPGVNLAGVMDEGAHIALERGSKYLDFRDMDEFSRGRESFTEILDHISLDSPDILIRSMRTDILHHPEGMKESDDSFDEIVRGYLYKIKSMPFSADTEMKLGYSNGKIICSSRAYKASPYSEQVGKVMEDYDFSKSLVALARKHGLLTQYLISSKSYITVDNSTKKGSLMDSRGSSAKDMSVDWVRKDMWYIMNPIGKASLEIEDKLRSLAEGETADAQKYRSLLEDYYQARERFFAIEQAGRRKMREIFFGGSTSGDESRTTTIEKHDERGIHKEGLVQKILHQIPLDELFSMDSGEQDRVLQNVVNNVELSNSVRIYLEQNPLLLKSMLHQMQKHGLGSATELLSFLEASIPELFARPLHELPDIRLLFDKKTVINMTDWIHVYYANQYLAGRVLNDGSYPPEVSKTLSKLGYTRGAGIPAWEDPNS